MICFLEHELGRLLEQLAVEPVVGTRPGGREVAWWEFVRQRSGGQAAKAGYGFRIAFPEAVAGRWLWGQRATLR